MINRRMASILIGVGLVRLLQQGCASMREEHDAAITRFTEEAQMFGEKAKYLNGVAEAYEGQQGTDPMALHGLSN